MASPVACPCGMLTVAEFFTDTKLVKMIETLLLSVLIIAIAMALFCVRVIFKKNGRFKSQHVHDNAALRRMGIHCVMEQDREARERGKAC